MTSKMKHDELNLLAQQIFDRIVISQKQLTMLENYYEEEKDYNIDYKPRKNSFIDPVTVGYIDHYTNYIKIIRFEYKNIIFNINIYTKNYDDVSTYIYLIKLTIICCLHEKKGFDEKVSLKLDLYLTELQKTLPDIPGAVIKKEHSKSGYSIFSDNIYICIYRKEEWFKSLIQELFFAFTLDLDGDKINFKNILSNNFCVDDTFLVSNSIVEFCARLFNLGIFLYFDKNVKELVSFKKNFKKMIQKELSFSIYQTQKILNHFGLKYQDLLCKEQEPSYEKKKSQDLQDKYKDSGDLFCYFLIPTLLFIHQTRIIQWINFQQHNFFNIKKSEREMVIFTHYIAHCSKDEKTLNAFEVNEEKLSTDVNSCNKNVSKNIRFCYHRI